MEKPRLIVNMAIQQIGEFRRAAEACLALGDQYDIRIVVSHLCRPDTQQLGDPFDPYLQYSVNFPSLFQFSVPDALSLFVDLRYVQENGALMARKIEVLRSLGLRAAFFGREPVYFPESLYEVHPSWRGPRVDHPRRSRHPVYAMCMHRKEVQELYTSAAKQLVSRFPEIDTFYWWSNDSGSGFCWYERLYCGPNGPESCRSDGPVAAIAAFNRSVLSGASAAGAALPKSVMLHTFTWDEAAMPAGTYRYPADGGPQSAGSVGADLSMTYPVRFLWDPLRRAEQFRDLRHSEHDVVICWLSDIYLRAAPDPGTVRAYVKLWSLVSEDPERAERLAGRLSLLSQVAAEQYGAEASEDIVEGWTALHEAFKLQRNNPYPRPFLTYLPTYGPTSHRWLTRPMVIFPERLTTEEEQYYFPHVFVLGEEARRKNLLDLHGYAISQPCEDHRMRSKFFRSISKNLQMASEYFAAAATVGGSFRQELETISRAAAMLACVWQTVTNWFEYAALLAKGREGHNEDARTLSEDEQRNLAAFRTELNRVFDAELENCAELERLVTSDDGSAFVLAGSASEEDPFIFGPDVASDLRRKRSIMIGHRSEANRLYPTQLIQLTE